MATEQRTLERQLEELLRGRALRPARGLRRRRAHHRLVRARRRGEGPAGVVGAAGARAGLGLGMGHRPRRLQPAVLQVVRRRDAERVAQLPRPPRRGGQRRARRLPLARRGGRDARGDLRRPARRRPALRQRAEGPRRGEGRRRRHLPADDPRGCGGDARVRAHRRAAQRRLRRLLGGERQGAHGVLRGQAARHRRRRAAQGQDRPDQGGRRRLHARPALRRGPPHQDRLPDGRQGRLLRRGDGGGGRGLPGRAAGLRAPAVRALHVGLDRQAQGHPAHHRRLPDTRRLDAQERLRPQGRSRMSSGARPTSAGSPATATSSTAR